MLKNNAGCRILVVQGKEATDLLAVKSENNPAGAALLEHFTGRLGRHSALMFGATALSGIAGFLYVVLMSRMLSLRDFAAFYALLNFFTIFSVPALTLEMAVSRMTSRLRAAGAYGNIEALIRKTLKGVSAACLAGLAVFIPLSLPASAFFSLEGPAPLILTCIAVVLFMPLNVGYGAVQGLQKFRWWGAVIITVSLFRFASGAALVGLGLGPSGAIGGSVAAIALGAGLIAFLLKDGRGSGRETAELPSEISGVTGIFGGLALITYLAFGDMLLVKHFFTPEESAVYGAASLLGRAVFYVALPLSMALFPKVCFARAAGAGAGRLLVKSLFLFAAIGSGLSLIFFFLPEFAAGLLFTGAYLEGAGLIKYFGFVFMPAGVCLILTQYNIALGRRRFIFFLLATAFAHAAAIVLFHMSLGWVLFWIALSGCAGAALLIRCSVGAEKKLAAGRRA